MVYAVFLVLKVATAAQTNAVQQEFQDIVQQETKLQADGSRVLSGPAPYYINQLEENQNFTVDVYVNTYDQDEFFGASLNDIRTGRYQRDIQLGLKAKPKHRPKIRKATPDWHLEDLTYSMDESNNREFNYTINLEEKAWLIEDVLKANKTAYVHMQVTVDNQLHQELPTSPRIAQILDLMPQIVDYTAPVLTFNQSLPLIDYKQKSKAKEG
jgi:hypothetical protein